MKLFNFRNFLKLLCCLLPVLNELPSRMRHFTSLQDILLLHLLFSNLCLKEHHLRWMVLSRRKLLYIIFLFNIASGHQRCLTASVLALPHLSGCRPQNRALYLILLSLLPHTTVACKASNVMSPACEPRSLVDSSLIFPYTPGACSHDTPALVWVCPMKCMSQTFILKSVCQ